MASRSGEILALVAARLASVTGLDVEGAVVVGTLTPKVLPNLNRVVYLSVGSLSSEPGEVVNRYRRELTLEIEAYVRPTEQTTLARSVEALDLLSELQQALEADRGIGGAYDLVVRGTSLVDPQIRPAHGIVVVQVSLYWESDAGEGS